MDFTLYYRGELKANGRPAHKHAIRRHIHRQLRDLWTHLPLSVFREKLLRFPPQDNLGIFRERHGHTFAPLICESLGLVAELNIRLLWPAAPGSIITGGGDIDNRLKTLLDALKYPSEGTALPADIVPEVDETPFYCLLEDDSLVTKLTVETDRLLEPVNGTSEVVLFVHVRTKQLRTMWGTIGLA